MISNIPLTALESLCNRLGRPITDVHGAIVRRYTNGTIDLNTEHPRYQRLVALDKVWTSKLPIRPNDGVACDTCGGTPLPQTPAEAEALLRS